MNERLLEAQEARMSRPSHRFAFIGARRAQILTVARRATGLRSTPAACSCS